jgi:hypothetical protein
VAPTSLTASNGAQLELEDCTADDATWRAW